MITIDIGAIFVGIIIGIVMVILYAWFVVYRFEGRMNRMLNDMVRDVMMGLEVELNQDVFFCYSAKNKEFVCQGANYAEIKRAFETRFPNRVAYVAGGDPKAVALLQAQIAQQESKQI